MQEGSTLALYFTIFWKWTSRKVPSKPDSWTTRYCLSISDETRIGLLRSEVSAIGYPQGNDKGGSWLRCHVEPMSNHSHRSSSGPSTQNGVSHSTLSSLLSSK